MERQKGAERMDRAYGVLSGGLYVADAVKCLGLFLRGLTRLFDGTPLHVVREAAGPAVNLYEQTVQALVEYVEELRAANKQAHGEVIEHRERANREHRCLVGWREEYGKLMEDRDALREEIERLEGLMHEAVEELYIAITYGRETAKRLGDDEGLFRLTQAIEGIIDAKLA